MIEAARALFVDLGYVATTINAIAERADVAPETVYASFGNKRSLLAALVDVSIAGDATAAPILEQDWVRTMGDEPDARRRLRILAGQGRSILERRSVVDEIVQGAAAADAEIAALRDRGRAQRFEGQRRLLAVVVGTTGLRKGLDVETATDVLYALGSPETWRLLVVDRGWTADEFEDWYAETLERLFLEPDSTATATAADAADPTT
ncbi:MAG TPA: helix-turn-helix domain-containing protein [Candidatus Limnocylindrales bacterium]|nr:helix-turn-helix domain-containing protein [Candidatus Limnocylindrales bacterium]